jgi:predicted O-methyltransferase YrrM
VAQEQWTAVDSYACDQLALDDETLQSVLWASAEGGLPAINVSPAQGMLLFLLARAKGARRILEIGTLGGYSATWLARALPPGGRLVTLELVPKHAEVARSSLALAGLAHVAEVRLGRAQDTLRAMHAAGEEPFDLIFIDADKPSYTDYLTWSLRLSRPGTVIIADNVVRNGALADAGSRDANVQGVRSFIQLLAVERRTGRLAATVTQTVGSKGYDGFVLAVVLADPASSDPGGGRHPS